MRTSARVIVVKDNQLLVMKRNKFGAEFYALIGGGVDYGETPEQALYREVAEEAGISVNNHRLVIIEDAGQFFGIQYVYLCDYVSGEPHLSPQAEEAKISAIGQNLYEPVWLPLDQLPNVVFRPKELQSVLVEGLKKGFPTEPIALKIPD